MKLPLFLAKDASGQPLIADLTNMPHMLIAGATGSGKSVCINSIITSVLLTQRPDHVKLILVDPKMVEMAQYQTVPHLMCPIINDLSRAQSVLEWAVTKMEERYEILREANVRNVTAYNHLTSDQILDRFKPTNDQERSQIPMHLPYIVIIIDELADLIMTSSKDVENYIIRLAQKSRAVGIHLIVATQRPSVNVVTGLIKSNLPCRISFRVASRQESRIVLDHNGAETLLGRGDMLFLQPGTDQLVRAQGAMVEDHEIKHIIDYLREQAQPDFNAELSRLSYTDADGQAVRDPLFDKAVEMVLSSQRASVSLLQRRMGVPFARAARLIELMTEAGVVGPDSGSQAREILITAEEWRAVQNQVARDAADGYADLQDDDEGVPPTIDNHDIRS
jgi:S-DNA-T family DNA segregation ATPase FtsK/SpoIIIE